MVTAACQATWKLRNTVNTYTVNSLWHALLNCNMTSKTFFFVSRFLKALNMPVHLICLNFILHWDYCLFFPLAHLPTFSFSPHNSKSLSPPILLPLHSTLATPCAMYVLLLLKLSFSSPEVSLTIPVSIFQIQGWGGRPEEPDMNIRAHGSPVTPCRRVPAKIPMEYHSRCHPSYHPLCGII